MASKPQGSSERVLPWQVTVNQLIFASLSHTHYWYEVGMLKVPALKYEVLAPWRSGPIGTFYNPLEVSSVPPVYFSFLKKECSLS